ncbi:hypothetical protein BP6252_08462 [Coleophoma cylindrospora]|uniref:Mitochondrial fission process protein 1 n=1 Tax=Coleophoma cylindrospora TaxID=1849047 RepID=A0A3D8R5W6_9HELO|nr:hypothetical protein BP6252_08462 [Coleophoma cylindrospora]
MAGSDSTTSTSEVTRRGPPPTGLPKPEKLPPALQRIIDKNDADENLYDELYDGTAPDSTESNIRYAAYATRIRTALLSAQRYVAYTSDIGESFRPVAHPNLVRAAYGISWAYLLGDVTHEGYKAYCMNQRVLHPELPREASQERYNDAKTDLKTVASDVGTSLKPGVISPLEDYRTVMVQRAIFQSIASMGLPAFTIHSIVRYSGRALKDVKNVRIRTYGPIGLGLAAVPALPFLFDKPVEEAVEWVFHKGFATFGGKGAVGDAPSTGREAQLQRDPKKEKEL